MRIDVGRVWQRLLQLLRLTRLSLAAKCQMTFGAAVLLTLALGLLLPYIWMGKLTKQASLDAGRAKAEVLLRQHFRLKTPGETSPAALDNKGAQLDPNKPEIRWLRFAKEDDAARKTELERQLALLTEEQKQMIELLQTEEREDSVVANTYVRIFKATESCMSCHNPQGSAGALSLNEAVGAAVVERPAGEIIHMVFLNRIWIIVAWLFAGTGAIVAFYIITQRVILRPIRQLRALANNVAEGNLDIRSSIKTGDEFEKLASAFNHMLDGLQATQVKLREANRQLDGKIAELSERNIELFKANKVKGEFLANISHEFKTPLNAILGFAQVLRERPRILREEKAKRYAENIITSGNRLLNMINDLLDLAKTQAGKMELHIEPTSVGQVCESLVRSFSMMTKKKKIKVKQLVDDDMPLLMTDGGKVQQILHNFLSNAVKFTPQRGRIEIRTQMLDEKTVRISVSDTGCGIAEADKKKIFEKFRQVDGSITRESTGTGLGLTISKELAAMLAGSVGVESELGKGSTFWLDIPVTLTKEELKTA